MPDWSRRKFRSFIICISTGLYNVSEKGEKEEVYHSIHEVDERPECDSVILHYGVDWREEVAHSLHVAEVRVVFVVCKEHVLHLFEVDVCSYVCEWGVGVWVWDIFSGKEWYCPVCSMDVFLCDRVSSGRSKWISEQLLTYSISLFFPPLLLIGG
jgi:hypothetical protein